MSTTNTNPSIDSLILDNRTLIHSVVSRHFPTRKFDEDVLDVGMLGLTIAANTFDASRNVAFSTFAYRVIYNEIASFLADESKHANLVSLDTPIAEDEDETLTLKDTLADIDFRDEAVLKMLLDEIVPKLSKTHARILTGLIEGTSVDDLSDELGIHPQSVRRNMRELRKKLYDLIVGA